MDNLTAKKKQPQTLTIKNEVGVQILKDGRACVVCTDDIRDTDLALLPRQVAAFFADYKTENTDRAKDARSSILLALMQFFPTEFQGVRGFEIP